MFRHPKRLRCLRCSRPSGYGVEPICRVLKIAPSTYHAHDDAYARRIVGWRVSHRRSPWRSMEAVEYATLEWVDWFNNRRLLEPIGNIPPAEAEAAYYVDMQEQAIAA
jgi:transposase InsO family protein